MKVANLQSLVLLATALLWSIVPSSVSAADWPMWRYDATRGAHSPDVLPEKLLLTWWSDYPAPRPAWPEDSRLMFDATYEPIVAANTMFISSAQTDSVTALDATTGAQKWRFYAQGPVRFAPVAAEGRVYFGDDDGTFYCLDAVSGALKWKFQAAPSSRKVIGNDRLISVWPLRGGPLLAAGKIYFTVGVWPFEGSFLYGIDVAGSDTRPRYSVSTLPKLTPQGYLAAVDNNLFIPCGRGTATRYDLEAGTFHPFRHPSRRGLTDYHLSASGKWIFHGQNIFDVKTSELLSLTASRPVSGKGGRIYYAVDDNVVAVDMMRPGLVDAKDRRGNPIKKKTFSPLWQLPSSKILAAVNEDEDYGSPRQRTSIEGPLSIDLRAGDRLYGHWADVLFAIDLPAGGREPRVSWTTTVAGTPRTLLAADGKLFVGTSEGRIYCFSGAQSHPKTYAEMTEGGEFNLPSSQNIDRYLQTAGVTDGFCLVLGIGSGELVPSLVDQSDLRVIAIDPDAEKVDALRRRLIGRGQYGRRVAVREGELKTLGLPPYMASLVVCEDISAAGWDGGLPFIEQLFGVLRPYGGSACLDVEPAQHERIVQLVHSANLPGVNVRREGNFTVLSRPGGLADTADWEHEYADPANTLTSQDKLVKAPLGVLWFGGPASHGDLFYDRHRWPPGLVVKEGRMFIQGPGRLTAVDIYTGCILWKIPLPDGLSPGRRGWESATGFHFVVVRDGLYLTYERRCVRLDPASGKLVREFTLPDADEQWGRIRIVDDMIIIPVFRPVSEEVSPGIVTGRRTPRGGPGVLPVKILAMDRHSGKVHWTQEAEHGFFTISVGGDKVFSCDGLLKDFFRSIDRLGLDPQGDTVRYLKAFDLDSGQMVWTQPTSMPITWLSYSTEHDILVGSNKSGIEAWQGKNGRGLWRRNAVGQGFKGHPESVWNKIVVRKNLVVDQRGPGHLCDLFTGQPIQRKHPVTGQLVDWQFTKIGHHCNYAVANEHLLTFRAGTGGFFDLSTSGTGRLDGFRTGCRNSLIPAGGVLNVPNFAYGCSCSFNIFTSLALVHVPENEKWTYNTFTLAGRDVQRVGINFGAPGDRLAPNGTLWLDYPDVGGPSPRIDVQLLPADVRPFRHHASQIDGDGLKWVAASGVEGVESVVVLLSPDLDAAIAGTGADKDTEKGKTSRPHTVRLYFVEPAEYETGQRVFDVAIEGRQVLEDFDIAKEAGGIRRLVVREFDRVSLAGELTITFSATRGQAVLSGVEVVAQE